MSALVGEVEGRRSSTSVGVLLALVGMTAAVGLGVMLWASGGGQGWPVDSSVVVEVGSAA